MNSHFSIEWFDILNVIYNYSISILDINPLLVNALVNTLFQLTFLTFLMGSSDTQFLQLKFYHLFYVPKHCFKKIFPYPQVSSSFSCSLILETSPDVLESHLRHAEWSLPQRLPYLVPLVPTSQLKGLQINIMPPNLIGRDSYGGHMKTVSTQGTWHWNVTDQTNQSLSSGKRTSNRHCKLAVLWAFPIPSPWLASTSETRKAGTDQSLFAASSGQLTQFWLTNIKRSLPNRDSGKSNISQIRRDKLSW